MPLSFVESLDREEHKRAERLKKLARSSRGRIRAAQPGSGKRATTRLNHRAGVLFYRDSNTAGAAIVQGIMKGIEFEAMQGTSIQHVKHGKPLTEHGAKLLGVAWPLQES